MKLETLPTNLEALTCFDSLLSRFQDSAPLEETVIKTATLGIAKSIQVRDYALGAIGISLDSADSLRFIKALEVLGVESAGFYAIKAAYLYESDDSIGANLALNKAFTLERSHSLSMLLRRVFSAGWSPTAFASMRDGLHEKVTADLIAKGSLVVGESN
jgi:hypothetical protein